MSVREEVALVRTATFHEVFVCNEQSAWCSVLWNDKGRVIIISDYGHWSYCWSNRGDGVSVPPFLATIDRDYMGCKMLGSAVRAFSLTATAKAIRKHVLTNRREKKITKREARSEWDLVNELEDGDLAFELWCLETEIVEGYEYRRTEVCSTWAHFWANLWVPLIVPVLKSLTE